ncbi:MAG: DUF5668 domain-containing protein [Patescibacteria group bacterium]
MHEGMVCNNCKCHSVVPVLIVLIGVTFLLQVFGVLSAYTANVIWPILLILIGLQKLAGGMCKCCQPKH